MTNRQICNFCAQSFESFVKRQIHVQQSHVYIHQCEDCQTKFKSPADLETHRLDSHSSKLKTSVRNLSPKRERSQRRPKQTRRPVSRIKTMVAFDCAQCDELFRSQADLEKHLSAEHQPVQTETPVETVDTASQTVASQTFEEEISLRQNYQHFSERVGDLENLLKREAFLRLKLEKVRKYRSSITADPEPQNKTEDEPTQHKRKKSTSKSKRKRSFVGDESQDFVESDENISSKTNNDDPKILCEGEEFKEPESTCSPTKEVTSILEQKEKDQFEASTFDKKEEDTKRVINVEEAGIRKLKLKDDKLSRHYSKKKIKKEKKRLKKEKEKLIKEAERARLALAEKQKSLSKKRERDAEDLDWKIQAEKRKKVEEFAELDSPDSSDKQKTDAPDLNPAEPIKPEKKITKKEKESVNFETLEYKREKMKEMEAQREKLQLKLMEVMRRKSLEKRQEQSVSNKEEKEDNSGEDSTLSRQQEFEEKHEKQSEFSESENVEHTGMKQEDTEEDMEYDMEYMEQPRLKHEIKPEIKMKIKLKIKEKVEIESVPEEFEAVPEPVEMVDNSENVPEVDELDEDNSGEDSAQYVLQEDFYPTPVEKKKTLNAGKRLPSIFDIDDDFHITPASVEEKRLEIVSKVPDEESLEDFNVEADKNTDTVTCEPDSPDRTADNDIMGLDLSSLSEKDEECLVEGIYQDMILYNEHPTMGTTGEPSEPFLIENHSEETKGETMEDNNFHDDIENCFTGELPQSLPSTPTYEEDRHDDLEETEISLGNIEITQAVEEDSLDSDKVDLEADLGFFESLSDSDNDEDYLEFKLKAAVYYKTPAQSEANIFTANFDEALSDSDDDALEEEEGEEPIVEGQPGDVENIHEESLVDEKMIDTEVTPVESDSIIEGTDTEENTRDLVKEEDLSNNSDEGYLSSPHKFSLGVDLIDPHTASEEQQLEIDEIPASSLVPISGPSAPRKKSNSNWIRDISMPYGWKLKRKGMKLLYKSVDGKIFKSRLEVFKHFLKNT